jgi:hypothetical protein
VSAVSIVLVDVDNENVRAEISNKVGTVTVYAVDLGDNSVQVLNLGGIGPFREMRVFFASSGAIGEISYTLPPVSVEQHSWGRVKARYR